MVIFTSTARALRNTDATDRHSLLRERMLEG